MQVADDDYANTAEESFRSLARSLLEIQKGSPQDFLSNGLPAGLTYATQLFAASADSILRRFGAISDANERDEAFDEVEVLIKATLLIALHGSSQTKQLLIVARSPGGRRPSINASELQKVVFDLMGHHGDFVIEDQQWGAQARLEEAVRNHFNSDLSESRLRELIAPHLAAWRLRKAGK